jgi:hypothetical protein
MPRIHSVHVLPFALAMGWFASPGANDETPALLGAEPAALDLCVRIDEDGYVLSGDADAVRLAVTLPCSPLDCATADAYDVEGLGRVLRRVKDEVPGECAITVLPSPRIPYDVLLRTVSAVRGDGEALFPWVTITPASEPES